MVLPEDGCLLRILIGESDKHKGKPLYEWIVLQAREQGLAGATTRAGLLSSVRPGKPTTRSTLPLLCPQIAGAFFVLHQRF